MSREFELRKEIELEATPAQVWEAIATNRGSSGWLFPTGDLDPDDPGVTAWNPPGHLAVRTPEAEDGSTQAFEYLVEARDGGTAVLRFVHSGVLGDNWNNEYEDMTSMGWDMYLHTLALYLKYFPDRAATYLLAEGPPASADERTWPTVLRGLGLPRVPEAGESVRLTPDGLAPIEGVVDYVTPTFLGFRTDDAMYRFHGRARLGMTVAVGHHLYAAGVDQQKEQNAWKDWLTRIFS